MKRGSLLRSLIVLLRIGLGVVFLIAALPKLADPTAFAQSVAGYRFIPEALVGPTAVLVPAVELVVGLSLTSGFAARGAALLATAMMTAFTVALAQAVARGIDIECGCFGAGGDARVDGLALARNAALLALALVVTLGLARHPTGDSTPAA